MTSRNGFANEESNEFIVKSSKPPIDYPNIPVAQRISNAIETFDPKLPALIDFATQSQLTYGELHNQAHAFASALIELGITSKKNNFITFLAENTLEHVGAMLGAIYLGVPFGPLRPACGPFELSEQIRGSETTVLVFGADKVDRLEKALHDPEYRKALTQLKILVELDQEQPHELLKNHELFASKHVFSYGEIQRIGSAQKLDSVPHFPFDRLDLDPYFISYTSGTTGTSKGAIHSNRSFMVAVINSEKMAGNRRPPGEIMLLWYPLGHMSGAFCLHYALSVGQTLVLFQNPELEPLLKAVEQYKLSRLSISAGQAFALSNEDYPKKFDLSSLKMIFHGGSKVAPSLLEQIRPKYRVLTADMYGCTELLGGIGDRDWMQLAKSGSFQPGNLGTVNPGTEMKIVDLGSGKSLPANQQGEICIRGPSCFVGYINNPKATQETIIDGWYHTGDVGYYDQAGCLFITDRIKEMIKFRYISVTPAEIEDFLQRHPAVQSVCVVGVAHAKDSNWIRAYVQPVEGRTVTEQELINLVKENMGTQNQLRAGVVFVTEIPRTVIGKVDRQHFKQLVKEELIKD